MHYADLAELLGRGMKDTKLPGPGFFARGQRLGTTRPGEDEEGFAKRARAEVYAFWAVVERRGPD